MADVAMMVEKMNLRPTIDWVTNHFKVDLINPEEEKETGEVTPPTPIEKQQNLEMKKTEVEISKAEKELAEVENESEGTSEPETPTQTKSESDKTPESDETTDVETANEEELEDEELDALISQILGDDDEE